MKLNLGCGTDIREGWINLDVIGGKGVDVVYDINKICWPFEDNTFDYIYGKEIIEHLTTSIFSIIKELARISKDGAIINIIVPHPTSSGDSTENHIKRFKYNSFSMGNKNTSLERERDYANIDKKKTKILFDMRFPYNYLMQPIANMIPRIYENTCLRYLFPASFFEYTIGVRKT